MTVGTGSIVARNQVVYLRIARRRQTLSLVLLLPALALLATLFAYPLLDVFLRSLGWPRISTDYYARLLDHPVYFQVFRITFEIALGSALCCLAIGYPLAYALTTARDRVRNLGILLVLIPFLTSLLVRTYAWMVILSPVGLINQVLTAVGAEPASLMYNRVGVLIGMTYTLLPYMTLTLFSVMRGIDPALLRASRSLGAGDWQTFRRVFLPLSMAGVASGFLLVFILALGYFITPALMGGTGDQMVAMVIAQDLDQATDWGFASALSVVLLAVTAVGFVIYQKLFGLRALLESSR